MPDSPHAVLCSLPRLADIIGYEERRPETIAAMRVGYPRFLTNPLVVRAQEVAERETGGAGAVRLAQSEPLGAELAKCQKELGVAEEQWLALAEQAESAG